MKAARHNVFWTSLIYIALSAGTTTLCVWGVIQVFGEPLGSLMIALMMFGALMSTAGWLLVSIPFYLPALLLLAQVICLPWVLQIARRVATTRTSRVASLIGCALIVVPLVLGSAECLFFLLAISERIPAVLDSDALFPCLVLLGLVAIYGWIWRRARRRSSNTPIDSILLSQFRTLLQLSAVALPAAVALHLAVPDFEFALYALGIPAVAGLVMGAFPGCLSRWLRAVELPLTTNSLSGGEAAKPAKKSKEESEPVDRLPSNVEELKASKSGLVAYLFLSGKDKEAIAAEVGAAVKLPEAQAVKVVRRITGRARFFQRVGELMAAK